MVQQKSAPSAANNRRNTYAVERASTHTTSSQQPQATAMTHVDGERFVILYLFNTIPLTTFY